MLMQKKKHAFRLNDGDIVYMEENQLGSIYFVKPLVKRQVISRVGSLSKPPS
jgi:hypothetical protein